MRFVLRLRCAWSPNVRGASSCPERQMRIFIVPEPAGRSLARSFSDRPMIPELGIATSRAGRTGTATAFEPTRSKCAA